MKLSILLIFGGESSEHEVSLTSARNVYAALDAEKYDVKLCYITKSGQEWLLVESFDNLHGSELVPLLGQQTFQTQAGKIKIDVIFPVLHGKNGEDGTVQGLAALLHIPIVGCGILASALCMDKLRAKKILRNDQYNGIKTAAWMSFHRDDQGQLSEQIKSIVADNGAGYSDLTERVGDGPWFVKPSRAGSSVGVSKVEKIENLEEAINVAFQYDDAVLVEEAIIGQELEVAVLGNPPHHSASGVGEVIPGDVFYSYSDKYADGSASRVLLDANVPHAIREVVRQQALRIYDTLGCTGLARVDFFVRDGHEVFFNEVNTMPVFTNISMYPKLMMEMGMSYAELCDRLISLAQEA